MQRARQTFFRPKKSIGRHPNCLKNLRYYLREYSDNTTIHGVKFLGEKNRSFFEKLWWVAFLTVSLYICVNLIVKTYRKWENSPVIVTFATSETPIWEIPFPAVTICPQTKKTSGHSYADVKIPGRNFTLEEKFDYLDLLCPKLGYAYETTRNVTNEEIIDFLMMVQPDFDSLVSYCFWADDKCGQPASTTFKPIITSDGICYSFNILDKDNIFTKEADMDYYERFSVPHQPESHWNLEDGYDSNRPNAFPLRTMMPGIPGGLELVFKTVFSDDDYICQDFSQGYKVILHHPAEIPNTKQHYIRVGFIQDVSAAIKINMITTSEALRSYDPKNRQCYFASERRLKFFKTYSQQNCLLECLANFTLARCDCVNFYMPRNRSTPICGLGKIWCFQIAATEFLKPKLSSRSVQSTGGCSCLPSCYSLSFDSEISQTDWLWYGVTTSKYKDLEGDNASFSRIQVYFKDMQFITLERNELYGQTDFLASCGGLLGLFTGFSFISLVEIIYFATLRLACNFRKFGRHYWSGSDSLKESKKEQYQLEDLSKGHKYPLKPTHPSCLQNLKLYCCEYAENTSIHGLTFLSEAKRVFVERMWWLVFLIIALYLCMVLIFNAYTKWKSSPVIVTFATNETPIWKIPFPAITICSQTKSSFLNSLQRFTEFPDESKFKERGYLNLICLDETYNDSISTNTEGVIDYLLTVQPDFDSITRDCFWFGKDCGFPLHENKFNPILTSEGVCNTFNLLDRSQIFSDDVELSYYDNFSIPHQPASQWSLEDGYLDESDFEAFPTRTLVPGVEGGLQLTFRTEMFDDDVICGNTPGYKVIFHNPSEIPNMNQRYIRVSLDQDVSAIITPNIITTSENLKDYDPIERKCYFSSEKQLNYFKIYNQENCLLECLTNFTLKQCGCVNFYMPRFNSTPICGIKKLACMKESNKAFLARQRSGQQSEYFSNCNCLPSCHSLHFDAEISQAQFLLYLGGIQNYYAPDEYARYSRLQVFFKDMQFVTAQKNELYGQTDFLASCGGLLGLFVGFSFISVIEFVYFFSLRLACNFRKYGRHHWAGDEDIQGNA